MELIYSINNKDNNKRQQFRVEIERLLIFY